MHVITVVNQKGGVGKTTTALEMCAGLSLYGFKVLGIDLEPQKNFSSTANVRNDEDVYTAYSVLKKTCGLREAIQNSTIGYDVISCGKNLAFLESELAPFMDRNFRLFEQIKDSNIESDYDFVVIDVPPSLGLLTLNALTASSEVIIPTQPSSYSVDGIVEIYRTIEDVRKYNGNTELKILGIVFTMYDSRPTVNQSTHKMASEIGEEINTTLFESKIRQNVKIKVAQVLKTSIFQYAKSSNGAKDYHAFIDELLAKLNMTAPRAWSY